MKLLTIAEARKLFAEHPQLHEKLKELFKISHENKKAIFKAEEIEEVDELVNYELLKKSTGDRFEFNFESLAVCLVLQEIAEERMGESMPTDITAALEYADKFYLQLRQPKPNHTWYFHLAMEFDRFILIWLNQEHDKDISEFYKSITPEMADSHIPLRSFGNDYAGAFPYLTDSVESLFETTKWMYADEQGKYEVKGAIANLAQENSEKAKALYEFAKNNGGIDFDGMLPGLLIRLYNTNPPHYFHEIEEIFKSSPAEGAIALAWTSYSDEEHIRRAFELFDSLPLGDPLLLNQYGAFYTKLIANPHTPADIRSKCFTRISELLQIEKSGIENDLISRLGWMDGYDEEKYALVPQIINLSPRYITDIFKKFSRADLLFDLLRAVYLSFGPKVEFQLFNDAFSDMQRNQPEDFEKELLLMLSDGIALIRFAGLNVMRSKYGGMYEVDFLKLDEQGQKRVLETLLPHPQSIEELLPSIIKLRKSPYPAVKELLSIKLKELIWAFDHHLIDMIKPIVDLEDADDSKFMNGINSAFEDYKAIKTLKESINEFNPVINELDDFEYYFQLEREQQAELMEKASQMSFMTQIAKNVGIIRGSGFKVEAGKEVTRTQKVATSMLIDMRYYRNPDEYEFNFQQQLSADQFSAEEENPQ